MARGDEQSGSGRSRFAGSPFLAQSAAFRRGADNLDGREGLSAHNDTAAAQFGAGRAGDAVALLEPLLGDCRMMLGPQHPETPLKGQ